MEKDGCNEEVLFTISEDKEYYEHFLDCTMNDGERQHTFTLLVQDARNCNLCPRMEGRSRVLGSKNGPLDASVLFIAEAPGRLGADRVGIPLSGDQTGRNFEALLQVAQLDRDSVFITNAILCNPQNGYGNNAAPTSLEVKNCSHHLSATIELLQPRFVVTLGQVALNALQHIENHQLVLSLHVGIPQRWHQRWLIPLYHPGARARVHRSVAMQQDDFRHLGTFIRNDRTMSHSEIE
jgi:uracil-DNA glycosylase family 4